ncbi:MAG: aminotransferase class IV [Niabella sp.]
MNHISHNGKIISESEPVLHFNNRSFRYGDGFFETIRVVDGSIPLHTLHSKRVHESKVLLNYSPLNISITNIFNEAIELCKLNNCGKNARVRLSFYNGNGSVFDSNTETGYLIEATTLHAINPLLDNNGLIIGLCPDIKKSCDQFANIKSANYLFSRRGVQYAQENNWDDALILNQHNHICESTIANLFWIKNKTVYTPPLTEGCVMGVMRSYIVQQLPVKEAICTIQTLLDADEVFLSNAVTGIRWVRQFQDVFYTNTMSKNIYRIVIEPLF